MLMYKFPTIIILKSKERNHNQVTGFLVNWIGVRAGDRTVNARIDVCCAVNNPTIPTTEAIKIPIISTAVVGSVEVKNEVEV